MNDVIKSRIDAPIYTLDEILLDMENRCRVYRWWLTSIPAERAVEDLREDISFLTDPATLVARLFGELTGAVDLAADLREAEGPGDESDPTKAAPVEWCRGRVGEWDYGPYHVAMTGHGLWGVFRGSMILDLAADFDASKRLVERLHAIESQGVMVFGERGIPFHARCNGLPVGNGPDLGSVLDEAEKR